MSEIESVEIIHQQFIKNKPKLLLKQIMNMRVGFFGIQRPAGSYRFSDNARFNSVVGENVEKYKTVVNRLLTCREVPPFYYGGEIGMAGTTSPNDGYVRQGFSGGRKEDKANKFTTEGRNAKANEIWNHISTLVNYRKKIICHYHW